VALSRPVKIVSAAGKPSVIVSCPVTHENAAVAAQRSNLTPEPGSRRFFPSPVMATVVAKPDPIRTSPALDRDRVVSPLSRESTVPGRRR